MIIGDRSVLAIESGITHAYQRLSFRALGFFTLHVGGYRYGKDAPDSTLLACSFEEIANRIAHRGQHLAPFSTQADAGRIADAFRVSLYAQTQESDRFFGISQVEFSRLVYSHHLLWAPDGDEAFDDHSYVIHFDVEDRVRLIAFKSTHGFQYDVGTLRDVWLPESDFYDLLKSWHDTFEAEWVAAEKTLE